MAIEIKNDSFKGITLDSYNKLDRVESLDLNTGTGLIRMARYTSREHRLDNPSDLLDNSNFVTIQMSDDDLKSALALIYKYVNELEPYKNGDEV